MGVYLSCVPLQFHLFQGFPQAFTSPSHPSVESSQAPRASLDQAPCPLPRSSSMLQPVPLPLTPLQLLLSAVSPTKLLSPLEVTWLCFPVCQQVLTKSFGGLVPWGIWKNTISLAPLINQIWKTCFSSCSHRHEWWTHQQVTWLQLQCTPKHWPGQLL